MLEPPGISGATCWREDKWNPDVARKSLEKGFTTGQKERLKLIGSEAAISQWGRGVPARGARQEPVPRGITERRVCEGGNGDLPERWWEPARAGVLLSPLIQTFKVFHVRRKCGEGARAASERLQSGLRCLFLRMFS